MMMVIILVLVVVQMILIVHTMIQVDSIDSRIKEKKCEVSDDWYERLKRSDSMLYRRISAERNKNQKSESEK